MGKVSGVGVEVIQVTANVMSPEAKDKGGRQCVLESGVLSTTLSMSNPPTSNNTSISLVATPHPLNNSSFYLWPSGMANLQPPG